MPSIKQYVSIFCFDNTNSRYIFQDVPVEDTRDLTPKDYCPNSCTPLYDAIGYTVTQLQRLIDQTDSVAVVTIITDGEENSSEEWTLKMVRTMIEKLKKQNWTFTLIGTDNLDVETMAQSFAIEEHMEFQQDEEGTKAMFARERRSRERYNCCVAEDAAMPTGSFFSEEES